MSVTLLAVHLVSAQRSIEAVRAAGTFNEIVAKSAHALDTPPAHARSR